MLRDKLVRIGAPLWADRFASAWFQAEFIGEKNLDLLKKQNAMLVMNHTAFFALEMYLLGSRLLSRNPSLEFHTLVWKGFTEGAAGKWFRGLGCETASVVKGREILKMGKSVIIMPEGVGATDVRHRLNHFHTGYLRMLAEKNVPIIPIGFYGVDQAMPWLIAHNKFLQEKIMAPVDPNFDFLLFPKVPILRPTKIVFAIGEPIHIPEHALDKEQQIQFWNTVIKNKISALMTDAERHRAKSINASKLNRWWHKTVEGKISWLNQPKK
ncbi:MAG: 1-acyl-sn-glycerol-3-phosphate acyltransferase [Hahellaceae bacterium]|nr:1-acyl-sn-glycerol-3-phosphate acyltransferase [Hahellaceae bacterium]MCP5169673.1 1-acyl-sn-glycerol-3-phosphate acyltransferase [Hahellaceae bacterium]